MTLLRVENLGKGFGGVQAIHDLGFAIESGPIHSIIGPNGAGKTTLFNLITGLYSPDGGTIRFEDQDITHLPSHRLAGLGISRTFQNLQIFFNMSAVENIMVGMHSHANTRFLPALMRAPSIVRADVRLRDEAAELMDFIGLDAYIGADAASMPYGALKQLEIARALATKPKLMLLDEPAAGLNPA